MNEDGTKSNLPGLLKNNDESTHEKWVMEIASLIPPYLSSQEIISIFSEAKGISKTADNAIDDVLREPDMYTGQADTVKLSYKKG